MSQETKKVARTKLKFVESEMTGEMIAYVTICTETGRVFGVRQEDPYPKKIVLVSKEVLESMQIETKVLYDAEIVPMGTNQNRKSCRGFIVTKLTPTEFDAVVSTNKYGAVHVIFGNKDIVYDPTSTKPSRKSKSAVLDVLISRPDIANKESVIEQFLQAAQEADDLHEARYQEKLKKLQAQHAAA